MTLEQTWRGLSDRHYDFQIYSNESDWPFWGGIYMFCSRTQLGWDVHYIGECNDLSEKLSPCNKTSLNSSALCSTHVHILLESDPLRRRRMKKDLVSALKPSYNTKPSPRRRFSQVA